MIEIRPFKVEDCVYVAEAHVNLLHTPFKGAGGIQLLRIYYEVIADQKGGIGFVALDDRKFAGFVCGIWDHAQIKKALRKQWGSLVRYGIKQSLHSPGMISSLLRRVINPHTINIIKLEGYELRPIVVLPEYRGQGIADQLTRRLLEDAKERNFEEVFLVTEFDNVIATKFYTNFGFQFEREINMAGNIMKLFRYSFSSNSV